ncbi:MAG: response regulator [Candidatus Rokubacteria bacterium]|nr:response regulator [Candidatus Rokubacteria bacterium]
MGRRDPLPRDSLVGVHVLVVDDDPDARQVIRSVLQYCGALVTTAVSANEALGILSRVVPDVVVVDIVMPGADGYWLIAEIRKLPPERGGHVPALACTAYHEEHTPERLLAAGFQNQMRKPIDPWELSRLVAGLARQAS